MKYRTLSNRLKLVNSYLVPKDRFEVELNAIRYMTPDYPIWHLRSMASMRREWATHNLLYSLGIKRDKTADCDLDYEPKWYHNFAYWVVGNIALWVIK